MSVTIESISKWQPPSVLHLLPFSRNNAGTASGMVTTSSSNQKTSYSPEVVNRGFPSLRSNLSGREKPRSKSAAVVEDRYHLQKQQQQKRLLRASSERLSRSQRRFAGKDYIERARSEYSIKTDRKLTQEVVTFAIKDINEQILGQNLQNESSDSDVMAKPENGQYRIKPLLRPALKSNEGRWPQTNARFWRSSTISPGEKELQKHKTTLEAQLTTLRQSKRVKMNVKDIPRSETPVGENDPDKLNMKQVIAFLQSSGEVRTGRRNHDDDVNDDEDDGRKIKNDEKTEKSVNGQNDSSAALLIAAKSRRKEEHSTENRRLSTRINTPKSRGSITPINKPESNPTAISKGNNPDLDSGVTSRPTSNSEEISGSQIENSKYNQERGYTNHRNRLPNSHQYIPENTEFRIPARIRQIRESTLDNRPFRLHRFLTLVSNPHEDGSRSSTKTNNRSNGSDIRFISPSPQSRSLTRTSKTKDDENRETPKSEESKTYTDSKGFFLTRDDSIHNDSEIQKEGRRKPKHSSSTSRKNNEHNASRKTGSEKIICLPMVPVDFDSDDDFISLPSMPSKSTRKDLVLSAHGHAILANHFPQVQTYNKSNNMRPHSEKILLKRRIDLPNGEARPSTVKPSDLVEWEGIDNPEHIFLSDRTSHEPDIRANASPCNSPPSPKPTNNVDVSNGERHHKNVNDKTSESHHLSKNCNPPPQSKMDSPTRSRNSDDPIICPFENQNSDDAHADPVKNVVAKTNNTTPHVRNGNGAKSKSEIVSPSSSDPVKLTLRKERNLTRELTYMVDMKSPGKNDHSVNVIQTSRSSSHAKNTMS